MDGRTRRSRLCRIRTSHNTLCLPCCPRRGLCERSSELSSPLLHYATPRRRARPRKGSKSWSAFGHVCPSFSSHAHTHTHTRARTCSRAHGRPLGRPGRSPGCQPRGGKCEMEKNDEKERQSGRPKTAWRRGGPALDLRPNTLSPSRPAPPTSSRPRPSTQTWPAPPAGPHPRPSSSSWRSRTRPCGGAGRQGRPRPGRRAQPARGRRPARARRPPPLATLPWPWCCLSPWPWRAWPPPTGAGRCWSTRRTTLSWRRPPGRGWCPRASRPGRRQGCEGRGRRSVGASENGCVWWGGGGGV